MDLLHSAKTAQSSAITSSTSEKHKRSLSRWKSFLSSVGIQHDFYLDNFSVAERHQLLSAFMEAIHTKKFNKRQNHRPPPVKAESCAATLGHLAQAFTAADRQDPRRARDGKPTFILHRQIKGYSTLDLPNLPNRQSQSAS